MKRARTRGTASVEAVVALPVLLILFASVFYVRDNALALQNAANEARTCAWRYSANNCGAVPVECSQDPIVDDTSNPPAEIREHLPGVIGDVVFTLVEPALKAAFGSSVEVRAERALNRPRVYGGGTKVVHRNYFLACNLAHVEATDVATEAWNALYPTLFGD
jgi:hypothetical protein